MAKKIKKESTWVDVAKEHVTGCVDDLENEQSSGTGCDVADRLHDSLLELRGALLEPTPDFGEIEDKLAEAQTEASDLRSLANGISLALDNVEMVIDKEKEKRLPPAADLVIAGTIKLEPDWENLRAWFLNIKRTDLKQYRKMLAADKTGQTARWLGEPWPLPKKLED